MSWPGLEDKDLVRGTSMCIKSRNDFCGLITKFDGIKRLEVE